MTDASDFAGSPAAELRKDFLVVGLGGSAGAIPPFREFFRNVPPDSGMAYVVILHLSPEHESRLAEVLQGSSAIPVTQVRERVKVEPNHVYVIPPNQSLAMVDGTLVLSPMAGFEERRAPVDIFFRTLGEAHDSRAVCVILSGSGSDGSMGLRRVKEHNGLVLVQDPAEAQFAEMPRHSIATGLVDMILPVAEMPARIIAYRDQVREAPLHPDHGDENDEQALLDIFTNLRVRTGHDFSNYKRATVLRRIERRMALHAVTRLPRYAQFMREHSSEADLLLRELLISVTNFFRDAKVWETVEQRVVPKLLEGKGTDDHVRLWVAGCATGEEAYSVAMLLAEAASGMASPPNIQVFATDLDEDAIARARNGVYSEADVADVSPERLRRHFVHEGEHYRVRRELRELILFAHHNLIKDPPFSHIDFVSCRNVLIYLNRLAQERTMEVLHFALEPGGWLLLGTAESSDGSSQFFSTADKEAHLYQSRSVPRVISMPAPVRQLTISSDLRTTQQPPERREPRALRFTSLDLHHQLIEEYAPPSLIIDEAHTIVHLSERAGRYLQFAAGDASLDVLQLVRPELRIALRTALFQAAQTRRTVVLRGIDVHTGERSELVKLIVRPALSDGEPAAGYFLVLFEESREPAALEVATPAGEPAARQLEEELIRIKGQMRTTVEQYEVQAEEARAANEELQAINEELRSTAEELETSQEELQSLNEELQTVNQELKVKIEEIGHTNDDLRNLMSSTEIGTIFVDRGLRVKLFTPRVRDLFNLIPGDVGRPLLDITGKLTSNTLAADLDAVLDRLQTVEREVESRDGRWYLMRLLPYRTAEDRIDGVVLTFLEVTEQHRAQDVLRETQLRQEDLLEDAKALQKISSQLIHEQNSDALYEDIVDAAMAMMRADMGSLQMVDRDGESLRLLAWKGFHPQSAAYWGTVTGGTQSSHGGALTNGVRQINPDIATSELVKGSDSHAEYVRSGIRAIQSTPLLSRDGRTVGMISTHWREPHVPGDRELRLFDVLARQAADVLERKRIEEALRESEERYRTLFESIDEGFCIIDVLFDESGQPYDYRFVDVNPAFEKQTGLSEAVGKTIREMVPSHEAHWFEAYGRIAQTAVPARFENVARGLDRIYEVYAFPLGDSRHRLAVLFNDITGRKQAEAAVRDSEQRLQTVTNLVPDLLWSNDSAGVMDWCNERWLEYTGQTVETACGQGWLHAIHPDDRDASSMQFEAAIRSGDPLRLEHRMHDASGTYRWFLVQAEPLRDADGRIARWFGAATDVHEQRIAREELERRVQERTRELAELSLQRQQLLERLVAATEEERQRIARELHDEMGQHLTALRVGLQTLRPQGDGVEHMKDIIDRLDRSVDRLTLELRPPALDHLGLHGAISSLVEEFSAASGVHVDVHLPGVDGERFSGGIETAIYRVVQEALTNVWKHSGAKLVSVIVEREADALRMIVEDDGHGFDGDGALAGETARGRFGLLGMRERLALVGGSFHIESQPGSGATIYVRVPLANPAPQ